MKDSSFQYLEGYFQDENIFKEIKDTVVETFKFSTLGAGSFSWWSLGYSFTFMLLLLTIGIIIFNRIQRSFMDTV